MQKRLDTFVLNLKRRKVQGTFNIALETAEICFIAIAQGNGSAKNMLKAVREIGKELIFAAPLDLSIGNVMRRVLFIIREQYEEFAHNNQGALLSQSQLLTRGASGVFFTEEMFAPAASSPGASLVAGDALDDEFSESYNIKKPVQDAVQSFIEELKELHQHISKQALEHIHEHEVILTFGRSETVKSFFKSARRKRKFRVVVAETAPSFEGRLTALALSAEGIECTVIPDAAVFAIMARVNKVIIGVRAVLANGGVLAHTGAHAIALAARAHHVPFVVLSGLYKFTPLYPSEDQDTFSDLNPPEHVLPFDEADCGHDADVVVQNPAYDYVPPNLVHLFITNQGGVMPPYIYQILAEYYHPEDLPELAGPLNIMQ